MRELIEFLTEVGKLKRIKRKGWVMRSVKEPETISDHTFRVTLMGWVLAKKEKLNIEKVMKMALIHDLCEVYAGDWTPYDSIKINDSKTFQTLPAHLTKEKIIISNEKRCKEKSALIKITKKLPKELCDEILSLWYEYEEGYSKEGRFVRQLDRIENVLQALEYQKEDPNLPINSFWQTANELVDDKILLQFLKELDSFFYKKK